MASFFERLVGAAFLNADAYSEIERDDEAVGQAAMVVVLSSLAGAMSTLRDDGIIAFAATAVLALVSWVAWAGACHYVGTTLLAEPATQAELADVMRTLGFSAAPGLLRVLIILPVIGPIFYIVGSLWMMASMVVALKVSLDYSGYIRPIIVCLLSSIVYWLMLIGLGFLLIAALQ